MSNNTKTRLDYNRALVHKLIELVEAYPDLRFSQILSNFGFVKQTSDLGTGWPLWVDEYSREPDEILKRVKKAIKDL